MGGPHEKLSLGPIHLESRENTQVTTVTTMILPFFLTHRFSVVHMQAALKEQLYGKPPAEEGQE